MDVLSVVSSTGNLDGRIVGWKGDDDTQHTDEDDRNNGVLDNFVLILAKCAMPSHLTSGVSASPGSTTYKTFYWNNGSSTTSHNFAQECPGDLVTGTTTNTTCNNMVTTSLLNINTSTGKLEITPQHIIEHVGSITTVISTDFSHYGNDSKTFTITVTADCNQLIPPAHDD